MTDLRVGTLHFGWCFVVDACDPVPFKSVFFLKVIVLVLIQSGDGTLLAFVLLLKLCELFFDAIVIIHITNHCKNILLIFYYVITSTVLISLLLYCVMSHVSWGTVLCSGLTLRRLMSCVYIYIYIYIYIYTYMEHPFLMFLDHTQRRTTVGRTPLDE